MCDSLNAYKSVCVLGFFVLFGVEFKFQFFFQAIGCYWFIRGYRNFGDIAQVALESTIFHAIAGDLFPHSTTTKWSKQRNLRWDWQFLLLFSHLTEYRRDCNWHAHIRFIKMHAETLAKINREIVRRMQLSFVNISFRHELVTTHWYNKSIGRLNLIGVRLCTVWLL